MMGGLSLNTCLLHFVTISFLKSFSNNFQNASMVFCNAFDMAAVDVNFFSQYPYLKCRRQGYCYTFCIWKQQNAKIIYSLRIASNNLRFMDLKIYFRWQKMVLCQSQGYEFLNLGLYLRTISYLSEYFIATCIDILFIMAQSHYR